MSETILMLIQFSKAVPTVFASGADLIEVIRKVAANEPYTDVERAKVNEAFAWARQRREGRFPVE